MTRKLAVVVFNLGGPDGPRAVRPFLFNLFRDPAIISAAAPLRYAVAAFISATRAKSARANYALMGGGSPLLPETRRQAEALEVELKRRAPEVETRVFTAMRYWKPLSGETAQAVEAFGPDETVLLPLYPQYSSTTTASSLAAWSAACRPKAPAKAICCYPDQPGLIEAHVRRIEQAYEGAGRPAAVRLLFSAHGLPEKVVAGGDPYQAQIEATAAAIAARLPQFADWQVCYQSRVGPLKWLGPSTPAAIEAAAEEGLGVVIAPIAFVSEHIETLVELDREYAELADKVNCPAYVRAPALAAEPAFIGALADMVQAARGQAEAIAPGGPWRCGEEWGQCPARIRAAG